MEKKSIVFSIAVAMKLELLLIMISMAKEHFYVIGEDDSERETAFCHSKIDGFRSKSKL
jgi:hypothetical protein